METPWKGPSGETIDTPRHRALGSASRVSILRRVREAAGGLTAGEVAAGTGQHLNTTRAHLERLVEAGLLVKARDGGGQPGRPAWRYRAAAADPAPGPYRALAAALLEHLPRDAEGRSRAGEVGRDWGRQLSAAGPASADPVAGLVTVLDRLGFGPRRHAGEIHLYTCPFLELVGPQPDAMCGLHAGVIRGVLGEEAVLEPFGAPRACVVRLPSAALP
ncbi:helix-turn-helix domain-containing protein [Dactylosporangium sp. NPDC049140]|uniref:helix-turn-helix transcriptional regulator n=1 Tax=Dactylosporangium sp. NPDC049140 TaxID=3155647 RepID=UPI00340053F4